MTKNLKFESAPLQIREIVASLSASQRDGKKMTARLVVLNIVSFFVLCLLVFAHQIPVVMYRYDGTLLLSTAKNQRLWMGHGLNFTMNFLEGNGDVWQAQIDTLFDPAFIASSFFNDDAYAPVVAFTVYAMEFFLTSILLGFCLGLRAEVVLGGAWLGSLVALPFFVPTLATDYLWGNPHILTIVSLLSIAVWLLLKIGRGGRASTLLGALGLLLIGSFMCFEFAGGVIVTIPAVMALSVACVITSTSAHERWAKVVVLICLSMLLAILFGRFLWGLYLDTKGAFLATEMFARPLQFKNLSHLLEENGRLMAPVIWIFGLGGALLLAVFGKRESRWFAVGFLAIAGGIAVLVTSIRFFWGNWWGVNPAYIDFYCYSLTSLFAGAFIATLFGLTSRTVRRKWPALFPRLLERPNAVSRLSLVALAILPWISLAHAHPPYRAGFFYVDPWRWPPKPTTITKLLQQEIGLVAGSTFRGRVASLQGSSFDKDFPFAPFVSQHNYDQTTLVASGNDHRLYGFWYFGIPTLIENNHFSSPFFDLVTTRLLNNGPFFSVHAQTTLSKFDGRVLAALGARFVITDEEIDHGANLRLKFKMDPDRFQYVYELPHPNTGNYTPVKTHVVSDASSAIRLMAAPTFDFSKEVVLTDNIEDGNLVSPNKAVLRVFRDHLTLDAESSGRAMIVLPVTYSHCLDLRFRSDAPDDIEIRRANLAQLAIVFTKSLQGEIALHYGPFRNSKCRISDYFDGKALGIGHVPWPKEDVLVPNGPR